MIKQDNLEVSFRRALEELAKKDIQRQCQLAGADYKVIRAGEVLISLLLMERVYQIGCPEGEVTCRDNSQKVGLMEKAILLRYLNNAKEASGEEKLIGFNELPSGSFYNPAFSEGVVKSFVSFFGEEPEKLEWAAKRLGGVEVPFGDVGVKIPFLPKVKISFIIWEGDDEFPPNGKVLFNSGVSCYLSTEGVVIASTMVFNKLKSMI
ncbi:hypothetical protein LCGC14_1740870 [marine sediment metagenome]|uniref:DUF3786 domain-containing protein n=1 Tax=marine sediment metagenome TaxID=412755 RepID=A0A0F9H6R8_9ZZZZ